MKTSPPDLPKVLREVYKHYTEFREHVANAGDHVLTHTYPIYNDDGSIKSKITLTLSFWDLHRGIKELSPRKREAFFLNVVCDKKQKEVAEIMNISTVSVGQYCSAALEQLAEEYWPESYVEEKTSEKLSQEEQVSQSQSTRPATV